jgi:phosphoribosylanthranilate isomerase
MTWIKICGITNLEDAQTAADAGADAVGFVLWQKSRRGVTVETVGNITAELPAKLERVGVFVDEGRLWEEIEDQIERADLTAMQLQLGRDNIAGCCSVAPDRTAVYLVVPASVCQTDAEQLHACLSACDKIAEERPESAVILDSVTAEEPGGTGKAFDWKMSVPAVQAISSHLRVIIAGGLTPSNVGEMIAILHPWGVDVSSGVESWPGKKDPEKVRAFIAAVREAEASY